MTIKLNRREERRITNSLMSAYAVYNCTGNHRLALQTLHDVLSVTTDAHLIAEITPTRWYRRNTMDWNKLILGHVTVPSAPVTEVGWRVRRTDTTTRFEITVDDGDTWTTTHTWDGPHTAGDIVRAGYAVAAQHPGARLVEFEEINGTWIPRIEQEEEE